MITVKPDPSRNLLAVTFSGHVAATEVKAHVREVETALNALPRGFRLLTDLSEVESMEFASAPDIERVMDKCNAQGVALVVRVVPDARKDIGFKIMSYFHYSREVPIVTCETREQAEQALL